MSKTDKFPVLQPKTSILRQWSDVESAMQVLWKDNPVFNACKQASKSLKKDATVILASYGFGDSIFEKASYVLPASEMELPTTGSIESNCSVGVSLNKMLEVFIPAHIAAKQKSAFFPNGYRCDRPRLLRVLRPGDCFGLFEAVDRLFANGLTRRSSWLISAGSRCSRLVYPLKSGAINDRLFESLGDLFPTSLDGPLEEWTWKLIESLARDEPWDAQVLYFTRNWERDPAWKAAIFGQAWLTQQVDNTNEIRREELRNDLVERSLNVFFSRKSEWMLEILLTIDRVVERRGCVYVPFQLLKDPELAGPFEKVLAKLCGAIGETLITRNNSTGVPSHPVILTPTYLDEGFAGLISLQEGVWSYSSGFKTSDLKNLSTRIIWHKEGLKNLLPKVNWDRLFLVAPNQLQSPSGVLIRASEIHGKSQWNATRSDSKLVLPTGRAFDSTNPFINTSILVKRIENE